MARIDMFRNEAATDSFAAGTVIFQQGDVGDAMYVVKAGEIEIQVDGETIDLVEPGGVFGELALIDDGKRSATAVARSDCDLARIDENRFLFMVQGTPFFALEVMKIMADRIRKANSALHP